MSENAVSDPLRLIIRRLASVIDPNTTYIVLVYWIISHSFWF